MSSYKTAESVSPKHPDKLCDQVSDAILDAYLSIDPDARCAVEVAGGHGKMYITGEVASDAQIDLMTVARSIVGDELTVDINISLQSPEIGRGVDIGGAGDQGIMVGYACSQTPELMPLEVMLARGLNMYLYKLWPTDGKTQVTVDGKNIKSIVASFQKSKIADLEAAVRDWLESQDYVVIKNIDQVKLYINPAGEWTIGGFDADAGLTGRKLVIDNYGPRIPVGGGCFSGKDATKVDRSAAYMARKIAKDYLLKLNAEEVYCHLAYAIGYDQPLESTVTVDGVQMSVEGYDLSPNGIASALKLRTPQYLQTARYGHFGHAEFTWEK